MAIGVPTGIKIFNWLATMWGGKIHFKTPMLFCIGFLFQFLIAGLTGIMLSCGALRLAARKLVLRGRAFSLRHRRRNSLRAFRRLLLLVPEGVGKDVQRDPGQVALLAVRHRLSPDVRLHAHPRTAGHAATNLYLRARARLGHLESSRRRSAWSFRPPAFWSSWATWSGPTSRARAPGAIRGTPGRSNGPRASPPPAYNFARFRRQKPAPALGSQAPGGSGLEIRVMEAVR